MNSFSLYSHCYFILMNLIFKRSAIMTTDCKYVEHNITMDRLLLKYLIFFFLSFFLSHVCRRLVSLQNKMIFYCIFHSTMSLKVHFGWLLFNTLTSEAATEFRIFLLNYKCLRTLQMFWNPLDNLYGFKIQISENRYFLFQVLKNALLSTTTQN